MILKDGTFSSSDTFDRQIYTRDCDQRKGEDRAQRQQRLHQQQRLLQQQLDPEEKQDREVPKLDLCCSPARPLAGCGLPRPDQFVTSEFRSDHKILRKRKN